MWHLKIVFLEQVLEAARKCYNLTVDYINGALSFQNAKEQIEGIIEEYKDTNILDIPEFNRIPIFFNANTDEPENEYLYNGIAELQKVFILRRATTSSTGNRVWKGIIL